MKRLRAIASLFLLITITFTVSAFAAAVPKPVMKANNSVLRIITTYSNGDMASGSGFVVACDKTKAYIITNWHVAVKDDPAYISVILNAEAEINASVEASDESRDLAVLKVAMPLGMDPLKLNGESAGKGDGIYAIGFPGGADYLSDDLALNQEDTTITDGIVSAIRKATLSENGAQRELLQISAAINHGNSGGPVLNEKGNVVGVSTFFVSDASDINGAVSVVEVTSFLQENGIPYSTAGGSMTFDPVLIAGVLAALVIILLGVLVVRRKKKVAAQAEQPVQETLNPYYETLMPEHISTAATTVKKTPFPLKKAVPAFAAVIVLGLAGMGFYGYSTVQKGLETGNIDGVSPFFLKLARKTDKNLDAYIGAMELLDSGDFESAEQAFSDMGGYRDSDEMILESRYRKGKQLIADHQFEEAKAIFEELGDYSDSADMIKETEYQRGLAEMEKGNDTRAFNIFKQLAADPCYKDSDIMVKEIKYQDAVNKFNLKEYVIAYRQIKELAEEGYQKAVNDLPTVTETTYQHGIASYRSDDTKEAESVFRTLDNYQDSDRYERIARIKGNASTAEYLHEKNIANNALSDNIEFLLDNLDFEDAPQLILYNSAYADIFLMGTWRSADGYYYFTMDNNGYTSYNLPEVRIGGTYDIREGTYFSQVNGNDYKEYDFKVIDRNTIDVFCYADRYVYTLYRN